MLDFDSANFNQYSGQMMPFSDWVNSISYNPEIVKNLYFTFYYCYKNSSGIERWYEQLAKQLSLKFLTADKQQRRLYTETNSLEGFYSALLLAQQALKKGKHSNTDKYVQIAFNILKQLPLCVNSIYLINFLNATADHCNTEKHHELMANILSLRCERATDPRLEDFFKALTSYQNAAISSNIENQYLDEKIALFATILNKIYSQKNNKKILFDFINNWESKLFSQLDAIHEQFMSGNNPLLCNIVEDMLNIGTLLKGTHKTTEATNWFEKALKLCLSLVNNLQLNNPQLPALLLKAITAYKQNTTASQRQKNNIDFREINIDAVTQLLFSNDHNGSFQFDKNKILVLVDLAKLKGVTAEQMQELYDQVQPHFKDSDVLFDIYFLLGLANTTLNNPYQNLIVELTTKLTSYLNQTQADVVLDLLKQMPQIFVQNKVKVDSTHVLLKIFHQSLIAQIRKGVFNEPKLLLQLKTAFCDDEAMRPFLVTADNIDLYDKIIYWHQRCELEKAFSNNGSIDKIKNTNKSLKEIYTNAKEALKSNKTLIGKPPLEKLRENKDPEALLKYNECVRAKKLTDDNIELVCSKYLQLVLSKDHLGIYPILASRQMQELQQQCMSSKEVTEKQRNCIQFYYGVMLFIMDKERYKNEQLLLNHNINPTQQKEFAKNLRNNDDFKECRELQSFLNSVISSSQNVQSITNYGAPSTNPNALFNKRSSVYPPVIQPTAPAPEQTLTDDDNTTPSAPPSDEVQDQDPEKMRLQTENEQLREEIQLLRRQLEERTAQLQNFFTHVDSLRQLTGIPVEKQELTQIPSSRSFQ